MADFELSGLLTLDSSDYVGGADEATSASEELGDTAEATSESLLELEPAGVAAGSALAGVGTAAQGALDETSQLRETAALTAGTIGAERDQIQGLVTDLSNVTFSTEEASGTLDVLAQMGVENEEQLKATAQSVDTLATSTGNQGDVVAEQVLPVLRAFGDDVTEIQGLTDEFSFAVRNSALDMRDLTMSLRRGRREGLNEMVDGTGEAVGLLAAFQQETGLVGRDLRRQFQQALREADGDLQAFTEETGISAQQMQEFQDSVPEGFASDLSDDAAETKTLMDELRVAADDVTVQFAGMIEPLGAAAPVMQTVGGAAIALSTINFGALAPSLAAVSTAAAPVVVPLLAITAAIGALAIAWDRNLGDIRGKADAAFGFVVDTITGIPDFLTSLPDRMLGLGEDMIDGLVEGIKNKATAPVDAVTDVADDMAGAVSDRLPGSDAETGPLSNYTDQAEALGAMPVEKLNAHVPQAERASTDLARATQPEPGSATTPNDGTVDRLVRAIEGLQRSGGDSGGLSARRDDALAYTDGQDTSDQLAKWDIQQTQARQRNGP